MIVVKGVAWTLAAVIGFAVTLAAIGSIMGIVVWVIHPSHPPGGPLMSIVSAFFAGASIVGARFGWDLARKWLP